MISGQINGVFLIFHKQVQGQMFNYVLHKFCFEGKHSDKCQSLKLYVKLTKSFCLHFFQLNRQHLVPLSENFCTLYTLPIQTDSTAANTVVIIKLSIEESYNIFDKS